MIAETALYPGVRGGERTVHLRPGTVPGEWYAHKPGQGTLVIFLPPSEDAAKVMVLVWEKWSGCSIEMVNL